MLGDGERPLHTPGDDVVVAVPHHLSPLVPRPSGEPRDAVEEQRPNEQEVERLTASLLVQAQELLKEKGYTLPPDAMPTEHQVALHDITQITGQVKLANGDTWTARSADGVPIIQGARVVVAQVNGATAYVRPVVE